MPLSGYGDVALLNVVANDAESTPKIENYLIVVSLKGGQIGKLINRILGIRL